MRLISFLWKVALLSLLCGSLQAAPLVTRGNDKLLQSDVKAMKQNKQPNINEQQAAGILIQQLQLNQMIFNNTMNSYMAFGDSLSKSIRDTSTRHSIQISGDTIIDSYPDYFVVENSRGQRYNVSR